jgi:hypothetical protein
MRKYLLNRSVIGALFGTFAVVQQTRNGPRDWRLIVTWVIWGLSLALAIGTVRQESLDKAEESGIDLSGRKRS